MKPIKRAVAITGEYEKNGQTKKQYTNVGTLFQREDGSLSLKIEAVPAGNKWDGWIGFFDIDNKRD